MATPCRVSPPNSIQMITRRSTQRQLLLRPDRELVQDFYYILGYLQLKYAIVYHTVIFLANHVHLLLTDRVGDQVQGFNRDFFSLVARSTNCFRGRNENLWSSDKPNVVCVAPRAEDVIDKIAYINSNTVEAGLVSHAKKWPGVRVLPSEMGKRKMKIKRPKFFFDADGDMPEEVELEFVLPEVWDADAEELQIRIARECNQREREVRERFRKAGRKFMGAKRVLKKSTRAAAVTPEDWFQMVPHVACKDTDLRVKFLQWRKNRQERYDEARVALREGKKDVRFPEGTYALHFNLGREREEWRG